jgi:hypothetical protein
MVGQSTVRWSRDKCRVEYIRVEARIQHSMKVSIPSDERAFSDMSFGPPMPPF